MGMHMVLGIFFVVVGAANAGGDVSRAWWVDLVPWSTCTQAAEVICSTDCTQVMVCLGDGMGGYIPGVVATCGGTTRCSEEQKACVPEDESDCHPPLEENFKCNNGGFFPDPYDCQEYHYCSAPNEISVTLTCSGTSAYSPLKADCSLTTSDRVCTEGPIPPCTELGQVGVVVENPAVYYICIQQGEDLVPDMYRCTGSMIFDISVATCVATSSQSDTATSM